MTTLSQVYSSQDHDIFMYHIFNHIFIDTINDWFHYFHSNPPNSDTMAFEEVLCKYVGEFGRYQIIIMAVIIIFVLTDSFDTIEIVCIQATPSFSPKGEW